MKFGNNLINVYIPQELANLEWFHETIVQIIYSNRTVTFKEKSFINNNYEIHTK